MGKKNLALVGTHQDYFADMFDDRTGLYSSIVTDCASPEDAATSYFRNVLENSNGVIRNAVVAVWPVSDNADAHEVFDIVATLVPCLEPDAEPGDFDVAVTATPRAGRSKA